MAKQSRTEIMRIGREWRHIPYPCRIKKCSDGRFRIEEVVENESPVELALKPVLEFPQPQGYGREA